MDTPSEEIPKELQAHCTESKYWALVSPTRYRASKLTSEHRYATTTPPLQHKRAQNIKTGITTLRQQPQSEWQKTNSRERRHSTTTQKEAKSTGDQSRH